MQTCTSQAGTFWTSTRQSKASQTTATQIRTRQTSRYKTGIRQTRTPCTSQNIATQSRDRDRRLELNEPDLHESNVHK